MKAGLAEEKIVSVHNWVKTVQRDFTPRGYKPLGESSTVVDQLCVPFLDTTYVLVFESSWATVGGTKQDAVLYAYAHRTGKRHVADRHTIFNGRDPMSSFYPEKIGASICFVTKDYPNLPDYWYIHTGGSRRKQILHAGAFTREHWVTVNISMRRGGDTRSRCEMKGCYETGRILRERSGFTGYRYEQVPVSSRTWTTGEVESSVLTKRNISRFYGKYTSELPAIPEDGAG